MGEENSRGSISKSHQSNKDENVETHQEEVCGLCENNEANCTCQNTQFALLIENMSSQDLLLQYHCARPHCPDGFTTAEELEDHELCAHLCPFCNSDEDHKCPCDSDLIIFPEPDVELTKPALVQLDHVSQISNAERVVNSLRRRSDDDKINDDGPSGSKRKRLNWGSSLSIDNQRYSQIQQLNKETQQLFFKYDSTDVATLIGEVILESMIKLGAYPTFSCTKCGKAYKTICRLLMHLGVPQDKTIKIKPQCIICGKKFNSNGSLNKHILKDHGINYKELCNEGDLAFNVKSC